ncbi:hypothetical protein BW897_04440 [Bacillus cereus]|uniref:Uncharacterized protein n=1 Tax=Bacillus cereus TaxID=1396 RepID=A0A1S9TW69_BACCE|nr:hypothetical protein B4083_4150 [Bacillus cereus]OOR14285.1 hypothetical protein BW897_04440 [Bacillus cereus]OOR63827.1 hypothetical protein BLX04_04470 [Bacillus mycoides]QWG83250.1 hypothetical protein EXW61_06905 [Bacillus mycoides]
MTIEKSLAANSEALFLRIVQLCFIPLFVGSKTSTPLYSAGAKKLSGRLTARKRPLIIVSLYIEGLE